MGIGLKHTINEIEKSDGDWILIHLKKLRSFLEKKSGQHLQEIPEPKFLDYYFPVALEEMRSGDLSEDDLINMFGVGLGQYFEEKTDYRWVIYSDKYGVDLALSNSSGKILFPISSTAKRLNDETASHFYTLYEVLSNWK